ncbi:MAG: tetratricopeptide repeat protein [Chthoniobacterales bacterium]
MKRLRFFQLFLALFLAGLFFAPLPVRGASISGDPGGHTNRGVKYAQKKEYEKAIEEFTKAIKLQPQDPKNYRNRGLTYRLMGDAKKSKVDYAKAIELDPETTKARMDRARIALSKKKPDAALQELDQVIAANPRDRAALRLRGYIYLQQGKWEKAIADYDVAINTIAAVDVEGRTAAGLPTGI